MLLPGPESLMVPVRPPIAAVSIATLCHVPLSGLHTLLVCSIFCHRGAGRLRASHCCCQAPNLPWAPVPPPHAAARSTVCLMGPCTAPPIAAVSIATLCHVPLSGLLTHCWCVPFF
ncbi:unnamed protein product, partial [Staurois parvus]